MNSIILMLQQEKNGWQTSRYATFDRIVGLNFTQDKEGKKQPAVDENGDKRPMVSVNKGEEYACDADHLYCCSCRDEGENQV